MLGNSDPHEKMAAAAVAAVISSSTTNEWPQMQQNLHHHRIDDNDQKGSMMPASAAGTAAAAIRTMEKPGQEQLQQQQQALKCPRCDSSNTKFCYYNNYSLSQPRHFCKACKRYWTRGGTLRNVPVGGGCRKNKRVRRSGTASVMDGGGASSSTSSSAPTSNPPSSQPQIDLSSPSNHHMNPLFFGLPGNPSDHMGFPFPRFNSHVDNTATSGFDHHLHQPQLSALGLGFGVDHADYRSNRFNLTTTNKQIQDLVNSNSLPPNYSIFSTSPSSTTTPTMASVLASKFINGGFKDHGRGGPNNNQYFQTLLPFEDLHIAGSNGEASGGNMKEVKSENGGQNRMEWDNNTNNNCQNQSEQMGISSSDPTTLYWSSTTLGGTNNWHDPTNLGSSVSSLI